MRRVLYVKGGWLCSLPFEIRAAWGDTSFSTRFSELKHRIFPASLLEATQRAAVPKKKPELESPRDTRTYSEFCVILWKAAVAPSEVGSRVLLPRPMRLHRARWSSTLGYCGQPALGQDRRSDGILMD